MKKKFYLLLETSLEKLPKRYKVIVLWVFNTKINKNECFRPTIDLHSLHYTSNNNGYRLIDLAIERGLKIKHYVPP